MKRFIFLGLMIALPAFAGNGSSGGGNIFGDQLNPWFLQNTKTVNYCVEIDPSFSTLGRERVLELVDRSINYWKKTFDEATGLNNYMQFNPRLASQKFILAPECNSSIDLKFQLGFLTPDQKKLLPGHKSLLGLAYRTHYDEVNLKGKGFIYIAPEAGPSRPLSTSLHPSPWSYGKQRALELVLTHEMGHIFGMQDDHYTDFSLMGARFADEVTSKGTVGFVNSNSSDFPSPLGCNSKFEGEHRILYMSAEIPSQDTVIQNTKESNTLRVELGLPIKFEGIFTVKNNKLVIRVNKKVFAEINLNSNGPTSTGESYPAINLFLTKKQKVFSNLENSYYNRHSEIYRVTKQTVLQGRRAKACQWKNI